MNMYEAKSQIANQALIERGRHSHKGNHWNKKRGKCHTRHRGMSHTNSNVNKNVEFHYYGKSGHIAKDCFRKKNYDSNHRYRKHNGNYVRKYTSDVNGFKNLRMFISENALSAKTDDKSAW